MMHMRISPFMGLIGLRFGDKLGLLKLRVAFGGSLQYRV